MQVRQHLATVAHAQRERVLTIEEGGKLVTHAVVKQNGFRPAFAGSQHVSVCEATTGNQTLDAIQCHPTREQVAHVNIYRLKASAVKGRSHLYLATDALLSQ